jgi:oligosaccharyltransferase complex subunit gamma
MRWLPTLALALLGSPMAWAAKKSPEARFAEYHTKSLASTPLKLSDVSYKSLTSAPRDYSLTVLLTAMDVRYGCQLCREFQPEWEILTRSWVKGDKAGSSRVLFGTLDFSDGRDTFMSVRLRTDGSAE